MDVALFSAGFVAAFWLLIVLPISICLKTARARDLDPIVALFVGLLFSWIGVIVFFVASTSHHPAVPHQRRDATRNGSNPEQAPR
jgi:uncharacterized membrane protein YhaH (DUF805 family)